MLVRGYPKDCGSLWRGQRLRRHDSCFFLSLLAGLVEAFDAFGAFEAHFERVVSVIIDIMDAAGHLGPVDMLDPVAVGIVEAAAEQMQVRIVVLSSHARKPAPDGTMAFQMTPGVNSFYAAYGAGDKTVYLLYDGDGKSCHGHYRLLSEVTHS